MESAFIRVHLRPGTDCVVIRGGRQVFLRLCAYRRGGEAGRRGESTFKFPVGEGRKRL
jgi:hypothetical protein